jgi:hypothetical protein
VISAAQEERGLIDSTLFPLLKMHYQVEYTFDKPSLPGKWEKENQGLNVAFGSTDKVYYRTEVPGIEGLAKSWTGTGWKGERINAMIVCWSPDSISQVRFKLNDLRNEKGSLLSKNILNLDIVRYTISNHPYDAKDVDCGPGPVDKAYLLPDRLEAFDRFDLPAQTARPVWLSIDIPSSTVPGTYKGKLEVISSAGTAVSRFKCSCAKPGPAQAL